MAFLRFGSQGDGNEPLRVLVLAVAYPPFKEVGAFRAEKVARAFVANGHEVHLICKSWDDPSDRPKPIPGLFIYPVRPLFHPFAIIRRLSRFLKRAIGSRAKDVAARDGARVAADGASPLQRESLSRFLSRIVLSALTIPDQYNGFIPSALFRAIELQRRMHFDLVYATAPPFSVHVVAQCLHTLSGIPWIAEYRDPWCRDPGDRRIASGLKRGAAGILRGWTMKGAARHVTNADGQGDWLADRVPREKVTEIVVAMNGITGLRSIPVARDPGPFRIVYPGSIYGARNPDPFFRALRRVALALDLGESDIEMTFVGLTYEDVQQSLAETARECGVDHLVRFMGWVSGTESRRLIDQADCLLLLAQGWRDRIPNKLFDYLGSRNPIIAYVEGGVVGDPDRILNRVGGHLVVGPSEVEKVEVFLKDLILDRHRREMPRGRVRVLRELSTERQMEVLFRALNLHSRKTVESTAAEVWEDRGPYDQS